VSEDADDPDLGALSELFGTDLTALDELQDADPGEREWKITFGGDINRITDPQSPSRRSRRGIGVRPGRRSRRASSSRNASSSHGEWGCPACDRTFLSHQALQQHYEANPDHADTTVDAQTPEEEVDKNQTGSEWIAFDDRVETFILLPEGASKDNLTVAYQPDEDLVEVGGATEATVDTSDITVSTEDEVSWRVTGRYLVMTLSRRDDGA
jgi:hypothetical protein